jgi:hypothetical protein
MFPVPLTAGAGALSGNYTTNIIFPYDVTLIGLSVCGSNSHDATIKVGNSTDDDAYMTASDIGDSDTPTEYDLDDLVDDEYPQIRAGTQVVVTVDYDGAGGTAIQDLQGYLFFTLG